ncbi:hypothetical protein KC343_g2144 [Hortaea werneckii]|nr:hypothetical protein KC338_g6749 [Hortaea werneckii]KAI7212869.1 hypothetical protein KC352_g16930 [Hortaea werneckii]KAI7570357.1 hypothetical protein KC317_g2531 [Hortaea werneckii]KAI7611554.1 hypothetical protein KC346_g8225 [Hortaea werneckii]KAI7634903.1 hypothetical protein KC343_g2144 [Hortaea werneckii]
MVVHHILPDRLRDKVRNCGCCGRLFTTESELKKHVELTRFCEVSPESRAKWDVLPPTSRQQRADTWCYEEDGTPSDEILVPNPDYTVNSESEQPVPRKRNKRKAADKEDLECATIQKKACRREETLESTRVVVDLCSPQTKAAQPPKPRDSHKATERNLDTSSQSTQPLEASLQTTLPSSFPLQGMNLHNHTPNPSPQHFQQPPIPPDPTTFLEWTGNKKTPYVPGNLPSLHGTDAHLARSHNIPLLTSGWAFSSPPTVDHLPHLPPDHPLVGPVAESLRAAREFYVRFDVQRNSLAGVKAAAKTQNRHRQAQQQQQQQHQHQQWMRGTQNRPPIHPSTTKTLHPHYSPPASHYSASQLPQRRHRW